MSRQVILEKLIFVNFKKHKHLEIDFNDKYTLIKRPNRWGKTTIYDGFCFVCNGTDSLGRSDFGIKPFDKEGNNISNSAEHSVKAVFRVDGYPVSYKRIHKEYWSKTKGEDILTLKSHPTTYEIDDVPVKPAEFNESLAKQFDLKLFRLLTDVNYFHSKEMSNDKRREIILSLIQNRSEVELVNCSEIDEQVKNYIINELQSNKDTTLESLYTKCESSQFPIKKELKENPIRLDELNKTIEIYSNINFQELEDDQFNAETEIKSIEDSISDIATRDEKSNKSAIEAMEAKNKLSLKISLLQGERININNVLISDAESHERSCKRVIDNTISEIEDCNSDITSIKSQIQIIENDLTLLRGEFTKNRDKNIAIELDLNENTCPTCSRDFDPEKIQETIKSKEEAFIKSKRDKLAELNSRGSALKQDLERNTDKLEQKNQLNILLNSRLVIERKKHEISADTLFNARQKVESNTSSQEELELISQKEKISIPETIKSDISTLISDKEVWNEKLKIIQTGLSSKAVLDSAKQRVIELNNKTSELSKKLAQHERLQFCLDKIDKTRVELIQEEINQLFKIVRFSFFKQQMNGGQNTICVGSIDGVPYPDLNTASKINSGLDIINVLSKYYGIKLPVFVDQKESVTDLIETDLQIISLAVGEID